ncbi:hypothetical protein [Oligoflexus tunisiensis]|uniref:hypothetical protein n=1 Tax=Oligoflexus tunisiensis TaxID=708132 RepID=UPI00114CDBDA|nr:hypothetical protein [Oligoflexus tunisiensis]
MHAWYRNIVLISSLLVSQQCFAFIDAMRNYFNKYQVGIEYSHSFDHINLTYKTPAMDSIPESCINDDEDPTEQTCSLGLAAGQSSGYGLFLQQAFRRDGDFYFDFDINFTARYLSGGLLKEETEKLQSEGVPLYQAQVDLLALIALPYIKIGYTPSTGFPDIFLSLGPSFQAALGKVTLNEESRNVAVALSSGTVGYTELELVFLRFGEGAFSLYASQDHTGRNGTPFYPNVLEGITDVKAGFQRGQGGSFFGFGAKLLLNWP